MGVGVKPSTYGLPPLGKVTVATNPPVPATPFPLPSPSTTDPARLHRGSEAVGDAGGGREPGERRQADVDLGDGVGHGREPRGAERPERRRVHARQRAGRAAAGRAPRHRVVHRPLPLRCDLSVPLALALAFALGLAVAVGPLCSSASAWRCAAPSAASWWCATPWRCAASWWCATPWRCAASWRFTTPWRCASWRCATPRRCAAPSAGPWWCDAFWWFTTPWWRVASRLCVTA